VLDVVDRGESFCIFDAASLVSVSEFLPSGNPQGREKQAYLVDFVPASVNQISFYYAQLCLQGPLTSSFGTKYS